MKKDLTVITAVSLILHSTLLIELNAADAMYRVLTSGTIPYSRYPQNHLSNEFLRAIEGFFTGYRANFHRLSSEFLRAAERVFTGTNSRFYLWHYKPKKRAIGGYGLIQVFAEGAHRAVFSYPFDKRPTLLVESPWLCFVFRTETDKCPNSLIFCIIREKFS